MNKNRLEAFSDGVIAIIITIMVLELKVPHGQSIEALQPLLPVFLGYVLSFVYVGIYWSNHHHMLQTCERVTGPMLWANLHLLFWLSLFPFATGWMGERARHRRWSMAWQPSPPSGRRRWRRLCTSWWRSPGWFRIAVSSAPSVPPKGDRAGLQNSISQELSLACTGQTATRF